MKASPGIPEVDPGSPMTQRPTMMTTGSSTRQGASRGAWIVVLAALLVALDPASAIAQGGPPLAVQGRQDLSFGEVIAGVPTTVVPTDPSRSAQLRIRGRRGQVLELTFDLPATLDRAGGGAIRLGFGPGDAHFSARGGMGGRVPFDPTTPWTVTLTRQGWSWVFLGGSALPSIQAAAGSYSGSIVLTVSDLGR